MLKTIILCAATALLTAGASAYAQTSNIFGNGGTVYQFDDVCHRVSFVPPGITDHEALNVVGQQVTCLVRREARLKNCYTRATLVFLDDHHGRPGDWLGVDELKKCGSL